MTIQPKAAALVLSFKMGEGGNLLNQPSFEQKFDKRFLVNYMMSSDVNKRYLVNYKMSTTLFLLKARVDQ